MAFRSTFPKCISPTLVGMLTLVLGAALFLAGCESSASQKRRYVFIDGGAHLGESYVSFQYINRLYIELHESVLVRYKSLDEAIQSGRLLLERVEKSDVIVFEDSAEDVMKKGDWIDFLLRIPCLLPAEPPLSRKTAQLRAARLKKRSILLKISMHYQTYEWLYIEEKGMISLEARIKPERPS